MSDTQEFAAGNVVGVRFARRGGQVGSCQVWVCAVGCGVASGSTRDAGWRFVQLRYVAATGVTGDWLVDDVLIDPRMR